ncbi:MAG TPA: DUF2330 domain-containing protein [Polyangiaceae bacterium]|nr:DUF2330 domain-containing protein [Polyangiaceae bacterium]
MNRALRVGGTVLLLASLKSIPAMACGGGGVTSKIAVTTNSQRIFMSVRAGGTTDIVAQITVPETTADYGVLIPVPSEPTLDNQPVSAADLDALDLATRPVISSERPSSGDDGCGCIWAGADADGTGGTPKRGVTASPPVAIGPVQAVSLTGESGDAVRAWLTDNGFSLPDEDAATFDRYVGEGRYFIAIRRSERATSGAPSSIGIHYTMVGDHRMLSLGFTRIGAAPVLAFTLFLVAPEVVGPSEPFKALTLNDLDPFALQRGDYPGAVESAIAARDSKAFVLESTTGVAALATLAPGLTRFIDKGTMLTRATTLVRREKLDEDVVFATPFRGAVPSQRHVSLDGSRVRYAGMGSLSLLLLAGLLRRKGTRAPRRESTSQRRKA